MSRLLRPSSWTLRAQLLTTVLGLFTVVMLVTGALTLGFTKRHLDDQLQSELAGARSSTPGVMGQPGSGPGSGGQRGP